MALDFKTTATVHNYLIDKNIAGKQIGSLFIIERAPKGNSNHRYWKCRCSCGNIRVLGSSHIKKAAKTTNCRCHTEKTALIKLGLAKTKKGELGFNKLYSVYKSSAKRRGYSFELDKKQFKELTQQKCHYCNEVPKQKSQCCNNKSPYKQETWEHSTFIYNGIDRKDNSLGYVVTNVVPCCKECNAAKSDTSYQQFLYWINLIYQNRVVNFQCPN